jgi:hypothetical protein
MTEEETGFFDNMKGTNRSHPYCAALSGKIGREVCCTIYEGRPSPCSDFGIHFADGKIHIDRDELQRCNKARAAWNLPPLSMEKLMPAAVHRGSTSFPEQAVKTPVRRKVEKKQAPARTVHHHRSSGV